MLLYPQEEKQYYHLMYQLALISVGSNLTGPLNSFCEEAIQLAYTERR
jgi:hypothetical protein